MEKPITITEALVKDVRFPNSISRDGSDAMNPDPDYSVTYVILKTNSNDGFEGHGLTFAIVKRNELCTAAIVSFAPLVIDKALESFTANTNTFLTLS